MANTSVINTMESTKEQHYNMICHEYLRYGESHAIRYLSQFKGNDIISKNSINYILLRKFAVSNNKKNLPLVGIISLYLDEEMMENLNIIINRYPSIKECLIANYINNCDSTIDKLLPYSENYDKSMDYLKMIETYYSSIEEVNNKHAKVKVR